MVNDLIYHDCVMKSPRTPKGLGQKTFQVGKHVEMQGEWRGRGSSAPSPPQFALCISCTWLFLSSSLL